MAPAGGSRPASPACATRYHGPARTPCRRRAIDIPFHRQRRRLLAAASAAPIASLLAACAGTPGTTDGPPAPAPALRVGDRWIYRAQDGFRQPVTWDETREIVSAGPAGIEIRVTQKGPRVDSTRVERWTTPGDLALGAILDNEMRRFASPLPRWRYPLAPGDSWNLFAANVNETTGVSGTINYFARVGGWRPVDTPAGTFDAIGVRVLLRLDDEEFWRTATECNHLFWFAPAVGNTVREDKEAHYLDKGDALSRVMHRTQHAQVELVSFRRG